MQDILTNVVTLVIKAMKNPCSVLCKTALMATTDLFKAYQDQMLDVLDPLLYEFLLKAMHDKRFVCKEAERALLGMTCWISPNPSLEKLRPYTSHHNPRVHAKAATCVYKSVSRLGVDGIMSYGLEPLIQVVVAQLNDQLPEAREATRKLVGDLHAIHKQCSNQDAQSLGKKEDDKDASHVTQGTPVRCYLHGIDLVEAGDKRYILFELNKEGAVISSTRVLIVTSLAAASQFIVDAAQHFLFRQVLEIGN